MTAEVVVRISCDAPGCPAYASTSKRDATVATATLALIEKGWTYREGDDYCPQHPPRKRRT